MSELQKNDDVREAYLLTDAASAAESFYVARGFHRSERKIVLTFGLKRTGTALRREALTTASGRVIVAQAVKLSLVIPVYNEGATLREIVQRVVAVDLDKELVLVDDGSTDGAASCWPSCATRG